MKYTATLSAVQVGQAVKSLLLLGERKITIEETEKDRFVVTTTTETALSKKSTNSISRKGVKNNGYAKPLEYGFRSHFVPGHWEGNSFKYQRNDPDGGMYVGPAGGYVRGHFTLRRAIRRTKTTQAARLNRKMDRIIRQRMNGGGTE